MFTIHSAFIFGNIQLRTFNTLLYSTCIAVVFFAYKIGDFKICCLVCLQKSKFY
jgi:hypothetical protein